MVVTHHLPYLNSLFNHSLCRRCIPRSKSWFSRVYDDGDSQWRNYFCRGRELGTTEEVSEGKREWKISEEWIPFQSICRHSQAIWNGRRIDGKSGKWEMSLFLSWMISIGSTSNGSFRHSSWISFWSQSSWLPMANTGYLWNEDGINIIFNFRSSLQT